MIEWKQQGQVGLLEGSGKKLKLEQRAGLIHRPAVD